MSSLAEDVREGLRRTPKRIPSIHFYDARGSELFEAITKQPEYYLTETERAILLAHAGEMLEAAGRDLTLVELGAGSAYKTRVLIEALLERQEQATYVPIDVSEAALEGASSALKEYDRLTVRPFHGRNREALQHIEAKAKGPVLVLFLGSSIGNLTPAEGALFLKEVADVLRPEDAVLLGTDMVKSEDVLVPAYMDSAGVTTAFNLNLLARINRELGADFKLREFEHVALFNREEKRMESHLVSRRAQSVHVGKLGLDVAFEAGEHVHVENSYKYTEEILGAMVEGAGLRLERSWFDSRRWFGLHLLRRAP